jgi:hypothetical protein
MFVYSLCNHYVCLSMPHCLCSNHYVFRWMRVTRSWQKKGQHALLLLNELSQNAALVGSLGHIYNKRYYHKGGYREGPETGYEWVMRCFKRPRYFYKMFRISPDIFMALHDLLVSSYGLTSTKNVTLIESLTMFLWIVGGASIIFAS